MSEYVQSIRARIGNDFLFLPAVTAVIRDGERFLLARDTGEHWSLIGGGIEPAKSRRTPLFARSSKRQVPKSGSRDSWAPMEANR